MRIKKLTSILLAATLTLGLVACGGKNDNTGNTTGDIKDNKITIWAWDTKLSI